MTILKIGYTKKIPIKIAQGKKNIINVFLEIILMAKSPLFYIEAIANSTIASILI